MQNRIIRVLLRKDLLQFSRDRVYAVLSIAALAMFIAVWYLIPDSTSDPLTIGVVYPQANTIENLSQLEDFTELNESGIRVQLYDNEEALRAAVAGEDAGGDLGEDLEEDAPPRDSALAGISIPAGFMQNVASGQPATVRILVSRDTPQELRSVLPGLVRELGYQLTGNPLPAQLPAITDIVIGSEGQGLSGDASQNGDASLNGNAGHSLRDRMLPMLVFFVLMMETFALANLIASEISQRTLQALVASPATIGDVLAAKSLHGIMLAGGQAIILLAAIGGFSPDNWTLLLAAVLLGGGMFTGIAMLVGSSGRDFIGTLFLTMAVILPLMIPALAAVFPIGSSGWVRFMPTYGLITILQEAGPGGGGWSESLIPLGMGAGWLVLVYGAGLAVLTRKAAKL